MSEDDLLELLIGVGIAQQARERRDARPGRDHEQALRRRQSVKHQRARRLLAHQDRIAGLDFLQLGGERAVRHLDGEEFKLVVPGGACDRIGTEHRLIRIRQADHHELAGPEAQRSRPRDPEGKQPVGIVLHRNDRLDIDIGRDRKSQRPRGACFEQQGRVHRSRAFSRFPRRKLHLRRQTNPDPLSADACPEAELLFGKIISIQTTFASRYGRKTAFQTRWAE